MTFWKEAWFFSIEGASVYWTRTNIYNLDCVFDLVTKFDHTWWNRAVFHITSTKQDMIEKIMGDGHQRIKVEDVEVFWHFEDQGPIQVSTSEINTLIEDLFQMQECKVILDKRYKITSFQQINILSSNCLGFGHSRKLCQLWWFLESTRKHCQSL